MVVGTYADNDRWTYPMFLPTLKISWAELPTPSKGMLNAIFLREHAHSLRCLSWVMENDLPNYNPRQCLAKFVNECHLRCMVLSYLYSSQILLILFVLRSSQLPACHLIQSSTIRITTPISCNVCDGDAPYLTSFAIPTNTNGNVL